MNFNDIKFRIERTLESLNSRFDSNIRANENYIFYEKDGEQRISITWGTENEAKLINSIMLILHNLANMKDNLKSTLKMNGYDPQDIEEAIDSSFYLQVLIDLVNQEKHGTPLKKSRSYKNPVISGYSQGFYMASTIRDIEGNVVSTDGPPTMKINAIIKDDKGNLLFNLDELIETCYAQWRKIIKQYNCI